MPNNDVIQGEILSDEDTFWLDKMKELAVTSINSIEEAAKQLIVMITVMQGIYAAVLAFSGIKQVPKDNLWAVVIYALPIVFWLTALLSGLQVFKSKRYEYFANSPDIAKEIYREITEHKYLYLNITYIMIVIGFVFAAGGIFYWLYLGASG